MALSSAVVMFINYSHDIATALLAVSGAVLWVLSANYPASPTRETELFFVRAYRGITAMAKHSLIWILVAGVPRIYFYTEYEWAPAAGDLQVVAIIIKHIAMFLIVGTGVYFWARLHKQAAAISLQNNY